MNRRELITGLISLVAAPAIVRAGSLMPVKVMLPEGMRYFDAKAANFAISQLNTYCYLYMENGDVFVEVIDEVDFYK